MKLHHCVVVAALLVVGACDKDEGSSAGDSQTADTETGASSDASSDGSASSASTTGGGSTTSSDPSESDASTAEASTTGAEETTGEGTGDTSGNATGEGPSFDAVFETVLTATGCTAGYCHGAGQGGLSMTDADGAYAALVDVEATLPGCNLSTLVVPGEPLASIVYARLDPVGAEAVDCFSMMPKNAEPLPEDQVELVRAWIEAGALR